MTFNTTAPTPFGGTPPRPTTVRSNVAPGPSAPPWANNPSLVPGRPGRVSNTREGCNDTNPTSSTTAAATMPTGPEDPTTTIEATSPPIPTTTPNALRNLTTTPQLRHHHPNTPIDHAHTRSLQPPRCRRPPRNVDARARMASAPSAMRNELKTPHTMSRTRIIRTATPHVKNEPARRPAIPLAARRQAGLTSTKRSMRPDRRSS